MKAKMLVCACAMTMLLAACGNDTKTIGNSNTANETAVNTSSEVVETTSNEAKVPTGYYITVNGYDVCVDDKMSDVIAGLGKEESYFEAPSCAFDGIEKTYVYSSGQVEVKTYLGSDGEDYVNYIILKNDLISTKEGLAIGDTSDKVVECYGEEYKDNNGSYEYSKDNMKLLIVMEDGVVVSIQYISNAI